MNSIRTFVEKLQLTKRVHPFLSMFVMACCIVTVVLLFVMQRAVQASNNLSGKNSEYKSYYTYN